MAGVVASRSKESRGCKEVRLLFQQDPRMRREGDSTHDTQQVPPPQRSTTGMHMEWMAASIGSSTLNCKRDGMVDALHTGGAARMRSSVLSKAGERSMADLSTESPPPRVEAGKGEAAVQQRQMVPACCAHFDRRGAAAALNSYVGDLLSTERSGSSTRRTT